jgi:Tfp pilus assembly protein PilN
MIEINLIPAQYKKKKSTGLLGGSRIPPEVVVGSAGGLLILLVIFHIALLFINVSKLAQQKSLNKKWEEMQPQKIAVDIILNQLRELQANIKTINEATKKDGLEWAEKLNIISDSLPKGVWLSKLSLKDDVLFIEGSAVSKQQREMINVHLFDSNLKSNKNFLEHFKDFEPGSIQRRKVQNMEMADFLITIKLNER